MKHTAVALVILQSLDAQEISSSWMPRKSTADTLGQYKDTEMFSPRLRVTFSSASLGVARAMHFAAATMLSSILDKPFVV